MKSYNAHNPHNLPALPALVILLVIGFMAVIAFSGYQMRRSVKAVSADPTNDAYVRLQQATNQEKR